MNNENNRQEKNNINIDLGYHYGLGNGQYSQVLHESCVHGGVNSCRTSSLPLAEFWQPDNLGRISAILGAYLPGFDAERSLKIFEYPTEAIRGHVRIGRPSMTDLMLLDGDWQIALEAKYTEYSRMPNETVEEWLRRENDGFFNRRRVGQTWLRYIQDANCTDLIGEQHFDDSCGGICYQFLHRTASACLKTNDQSGKKPVLIYQLFFDANNPVSREDRLVFERNLEKWAHALKLKNMKFLILAVPVLNADEIVAHYSGMKSEIFEEMAAHTVYKFDFDGITIKEVL